MSCGKVESQYLVRVLSPCGHSISSHSSASPRASRTRNRAKRDDKLSAVPSRHLIVFQAFLPSPKATSLTVIKFGSASRAQGGLRPGLGPVPGFHTIGLDWIAAT